MESVFKPRTHTCVNFKNTYCIHTNIHTKFSRQQFQASKLQLQTQKITQNKENETKEK